jgi:hypothetical protein
MRLGPQIPRPPVILASVATGTVFQQPAKGALLTMRGEGGIIYSVDSSMWGIWPVLCILLAPRSSFTTTKLLTGQVPHRWW